MRIAIWNRHNVNTGTTQRIACTVLRYLASGKRAKIMAHFPTRDAVRYVSRKSLEVKHYVHSRR